MRDSAGFAIAHAQVPELVVRSISEVDIFSLHGLSLHRQRKEGWWTNLFAFALKAIVDILKVDVKDFIEANKCSFIGWEKYQFYTSFSCILLLNVRLTFKRPTLIIQRES